MDDFLKIMKSMKGESCVLQAPFYCGHSADQILGGTYMLGFVQW